MNYSNFQPIYMLIISEKTYIKIKYFIIKNTKNYLVDNQYKTEQKNVLFDVMKPQYATG